MFSLILAIIISSSLTSHNRVKAELQDVEFGANGPEIQQPYFTPSYGHLTPYYDPEAPLSQPAFTSYNNQQAYRFYPQNVYIPGRVNDYYSYPYRSFPLYATSGMYNEPHNPQHSSSSYRETSENFKNYLCSQYQSDHGIQIPCSENGEKVNQQFRNTIPPVTDLISNKPINTLSSNNSKKISLGSEEDTSTGKTERSLQMTYLGVIPLSTVRADSENIPSTYLNKYQIPFNPSRISTIRTIDTSVNEFPFSYGNEPLTQNLNNYQQTGINPMGYYGGNTRPINSWFPQQQNPMYYSSNQYYPSTNTQYSTGSQQTGSPIIPSISRYILNNIMGQNQGAPLFRRSTPYSETPVGKTLNDYSTIDDTQKENVFNLRSGGTQYQPVPYEESEVQYYSYPIENHYTGYEYNTPYSRTFSHLFHHDQRDENYEDNVNTDETMREEIINRFGPEGLSR